MYANCTSKTCNAVDCVFNCSLAKGHKVRKFVNNNHDARHLFIATLCAVRVVVVNVSILVGFKEQNTSVHFSDCPVEGADCLVNVTDDFIKHQVRQTCVVRHFNAFGVNENKSHILGACLVQQTDEERVDAHTLACAGCTCNQHVRQVFYVAYVDLVVKVNAKCKG